MPIGSFGEREWRKGRSKDETFLEDFKRKCKLSGLQLAICCISTMLGAFFPVTAALRQNEETDT